MSVMAKQTLVSTLQKKLGHLVSVDQLDQITAILNVELSDYEVEMSEMASSDTDTKDFLEAFFQAKALESKAKGTIELYTYVLNRFFQYTNTSVRQITIFHLRAWLQSEKTRGISDCTLEGNRWVLSSFFSWCHREGLLPNNPTANLAPIKCAKVVRFPFTDVEVEKIRNACNSDRDRALVMFLLATGCRISEAMSLNISDINFEKNECIVFGKGSKERKVYLTDIAALYLKTYLNGRKDDNPELFTTRQHTRLSTNGARKLMQELSVRSGVENVHPHRFRRTLATNLIAHGMPIQEVAAILGHEDIDTTMTYVYLSDNDIHNSYKKYA